VKQLVVGTVNPRLTQFTAAFTLALGIGAVVAVAVVGLTYNITSTCEKTCSGLPLHIAATDGGTCETVYLEDDLTRLPVPATATIWADVPLGDRNGRNNGYSEPVRGGNVEDSNWEVGLYLELINVNGTVSKDFDFRNLKCTLPTPESYTRTDWSVEAVNPYSAGQPYWYFEGHGSEGVNTTWQLPPGKTTCETMSVDGNYKYPDSLTSEQIRHFAGLQELEDPDSMRLDVVRRNVTCGGQLFCSWNKVYSVPENCSKFFSNPDNARPNGWTAPKTLQFGVPYVHWMNVDALTSTRLRVNPGKEWDNYDITNRNKINSGKSSVASLSCCHTKDGKIKTSPGTSAPPSTGNTKAWYAAQLKAEVDDMLCVHFELTSPTPVVSSSSGVTMALDNTMTQGPPLTGYGSCIDSVTGLREESCGSTSSTFFSKENMALLQGAANNLTSLNPAFVDRMTRVQKKSYVYCCTDVCPSVTAALGSALGYAGYIEVVLTVLFIFLYMRVFGGTMTDGSNNGKPMTFKDILSIAQEEEKDDKSAVAGNA